LEGLEAAAQLQTSRSSLIESELFVRVTLRLSVVTEDARISARAEEYALIVAAYVSLPIEELIAAFERPSASQSLIHFIYSHNFFPKI
jgi:hypothetical protein